MLAGALGLVVHGIAIIRAGVGRTTILATLKDPREDAHRATDRDHINEIATCRSRYQSRARGPMCSFGANVWMERPRKESGVRASGVVTS
jgi:hypothetical protein